MATARAGAALVGVEIVAGRRPRRFGTASVAGDRELVTGDCGGGSHGCTYVQQSHRCTAPPFGRPAQAIRQE
jgi:hypothetical protein